MVLGKNDLKIHGKVLPPDIKRMLQRKKVLIVLDDVNDPQDLKYLVGEDGLFGQGSRIMVTSRDRQVLINARDEDKIYEVEILDKDDALRLFSLHAFKQDHPIEEYIGLSKIVVSCVKGIPLVLEVLGASLYNKRSVEYWESKEAQLRTRGSEEIENCLEMCYQELRDTEKKIFLDIACFFGRCERDVLQQTLDLEEISGIHRLADMCLIKIVQDKIWMHDVLLKLGQEIVLRKNVDPRERSRLWRADDVYRVLTTPGTRSKVESISLILDATKELRLSPTAFEGIYNLRLLKIFYPPFLKDPSKEQIMNGKRVGIHLPGGLHFLSSELRFLYWYNYPLKSMPSSIGCLSQLVRLNLPLCESLASLPDNIDELKSLVELDLYSCSKLESLPNSICKLKCLTKLNLGCQPKLASLPDNIGELRSLVKLSLSSCSELASLPDSIGELRSLVKLSLSSCSKLASLPDSIGELRSLVEFRVSSCSGLASLPDSIGGLKSLEWFDLNGCFGLASLPDNIGGLKSLQWFDLNDCFGLANLPDTIGALKSLQSLSLRGCLGLASLPDIISGLKSLIWLNLSGCSGLKSLPDSIGELKHLTTLLLSGCLKLASLPDNFIDLEFRGLDKQRCYMLRGFQKVEEIASSTYKLGCHEFLNLGNSRVLKTPESLGSLVSLTNLRLSQIDFERIPASIKHLTKLRELFLDECKRLQCLPELPSTLQVLIASGCISLKSVASIFMQGDRENEAASQEFNFSECLQLDQNSRTRIMGDARLQIQRTATSLFDQQYHCKPIRVRLCIPGSEVPECFSYKNREGSSVKIGQPAHCYRGFTFCAVVSFGQSGERRPVNIECECHLIIKDGTQIDLSSYYYREYEGMASSTVWKREHVFIWSVHSKCFFKEASFHFKPLCGATDVVVQCGVHPLLK